MSGVVVGGRRKKKNASYCGNFCPWQEAKRPRAPPEGEEVRTTNDGFGFFWCVLHGADGCFLAVVAPGIVIVSPEDLPPPPLGMRGGMCGFRRLQHPAFNVHARGCAICSLPIEFWLLTDNAWWGGKDRYSLRNTYVRKSDIQPFSAHVFGRRLLSLSLSVSCCLEPRVLERYESTSPHKVIDLGPQ